jgi:hypothetical protein
MRLSLLLTSLVLSLGAYAQYSVPPVVPTEAPGDDEDVIIMDDEEDEDDDIDSDDNEG